MAARDPNLKRVAERLEAALDETLANTPIDVLVLGPDVSGPSLDGPALLRKEILDRCLAFGASVLGEHQELIQTSQKRLGEGHNLCTYERTLAESVDLIVILPASPGSIAELGLFSLHRPTAPKTLVLFSHQHRHESSYIMDGPRRALEMQRAKIAFIDYAKTDKAWRIVQTAIEQARAMKLAPRDR